MQETDQLTIDTPEQVTLELPIAGIGSRFLAIVVDTLVQVLIGVVAIFVAVLFSLGTSGSFWRNIGPAMFLIAVFVIYWGYFTLFEIFWSGQTPGKRMAAIRVIKMAGRPIDPSSAVVRNLLRAVDLLPAMYGAGVLCMLFNRHSRRIGDFAAGTVVVHDRKAPEFRSEWTTTAAASGAALSHPVTLSPDEVVLIETYLVRRFDAPERVRSDMAARITQVLATRHNLQPDPQEHVDDFLQRVAKSAREAGR